MKYLAHLSTDNLVELRDANLNEIEVIQDNTWNKKGAETFRTMILMTLERHPDIIFCDKGYGISMSIKDCYQLEIDIRFAGCCDQYLSTQINGADNDSVMVVRDIWIRDKYVLINGFNLTRCGVESAIRKYYIDEVLTCI